MRYLLSTESDNSAHISEQRKTRAFGSMIFSEFWRWEIPVYPSSSNNNYLLNNKGFRIRMSSLKTIKRVQKPKGITWNQVKNVITPFTKIWLVRRWINAEIQGTLCRPPFNSRYEFFCMFSASTNTSSPTACSRF